MKLIELDGRITVPQIVDAIDAQPRQGTDVPMDRIQSCWRPWSTTGTAKNHRGESRHPLQDGRIKTLVLELQECGPEFLGHIYTAALAVLGSVKQAVDWIIGPLDMHKPVGVMGALPKLDIIPVQSQGFSFAHPGPCQTEEIGVVLRIALAHSAQIVIELRTRKGEDDTRGNAALWQIFPQPGSRIAVQHFFIDRVGTNHMQSADQVFNILRRVALMLLHHKRLDLRPGETPELLCAKGGQEMVPDNAPHDAPR